MWYQFREKASKKLCKPQLLNIALRNLRNYSGERFYKSLPIRDPIALMQHFRHKKLERTMHYVRAIIIDYEEDEEWISLITNSPEEECKAIEKGYQLVRAINETKAIYRKRK
jgi:ribulose bisphosphate carboxylase small subunit